MKKSALKSLIREEITSTLKGEQPLDEMAKIQGELKTAVDKVLTDNPDLEGKEIKRAIKNDPDVKDILDETGDELYDNQLNKFIATFRGERILQQRGRKEGGTNRKPESPAPEREMTLEGEEELDEMAKISGDLESAIKAVISANPEIEGLPLKKQIKANPDVIKALDGDDLYDNQLNKFIANIKAGKDKGQQGRKPSEVKTATPGAPRPSTTTKPKEKEKSYSIAPSQTSYTVDKTKVPDENDKLKGVAEPTDYELKQMARSKNVEDERGETLKQQEQRKLVKAFAEKMKKAGIIDGANRILDIAKYDEEWTKEKPIIKDKVASIQ
jgi:hypothetical protein